MVMKSSSLWQGCKRQNASLPRPVWEEGAVTKWDVVPSIEHVFAVSTHQCSYTHAKNNGKANKCHGH